MRPVGFVFKLVLLCLLFAAPYAAASERTPLSIETPNGTHNFRVELAITPAERGKGLMFRRSLPEDYGMLFDFERDQPAHFWMKNTFVSLDILFVGSDGIVKSIAENTVPLSLDIIESGVPVRFVLEVVAGTTARLGIEPGARVRHTRIQSPPG